MHDDNFLEQKLISRKNEGSYRVLKTGSAGVDFSSNDYLGIAKNALLNPEMEKLGHGSTGSRLLTGNSILAETLENTIADFHDGDAALLFNSGYDANLGVLSAIPQKGDTILYDFLSHASIRDGLRLSKADSFPFRHNDTVDLAGRLQSAKGNVFVVTESVFSMDGDIAPLTDFCGLCDQYGAHLIVDEAHATGIVGQSGAGVVQQLGLQDRCFARIHTFGKAVGCHGAAVVGSLRLKDYLINFSRNFIYTTALPDVTIAAISSSYQLFPGMNSERQHLETLIATFQASGLAYEKLKSETAIQGVIVPGNGEVKKISSMLAGAGLDVRPILYPTVPKGSERLRIVLHSFNKPGELAMLIKLLS
ncbi:MAG TPA: 8-amino-7-oxononanoate synthase [Flavitalea sp.]|nr:8-amino-7-oxononanoate synthase [Flavitalea sp.]